MPAIPTRVNVTPVDGQVAIEIADAGIETLDPNAALYMAAEIQRAVAFIRRQDSTATSVLADTEREVG